MQSELTDSKTLTSSCWVCGSVRTVPWKARTVPRELTPEDFRITDSHYGTTLALRRCLDCDFIFSESEEVAFLTRLYEQMADQEYENSQDTRVLQMRWLISAARRLQPEARSLLDIGAGSGLLVREAGRQGLEAIGVEPSRALVEAARSQNKADVRLGTFPHPQLRGRHFDLVFLVDVIEHVNNPLELLRHCADALNHRGVVVLVTPDVFSLTARIVGKRWWHFRPAHVGYFSSKSLAALSHAAGLRVLQRFRARWFFRVYYLAERLEEYLPLGGLNRWSKQFGPLQWLYQRTVPVNLHDSTVLILGKTTVRETL